MLMKLLNLFIKNKTKERSGRFSEFFLHASEKEKEKIFKEAARKANEEQREVFTRHHYKTKTE